MARWTGFTGNVKFKPIKGGKKGNPFKRFPSTRAYLSDTSSTQVTRTKKPKALRGRP